MGGWPPRRPGVMSERAGVGSADRCASDPGHPLPPVPRWPGFRHAGRSRVHDRPDRSRSGIADRHRRSRCELRRPQSTATTARSRRAPRSPSAFRAVVGSDCSQGRRGLPSRAAIRCSGVTLSSPCSAAKARMRPRGESGGGGPSLTSPPGIIAAKATPTCCGSFRSTRGTAGPGCDGAPARARPPADRSPGGPGHLGRAVVVGSRVKALATEPGPRHERHHRDATIPARFRARICQNLRRTAPSTGARTPDVPRRSCRPPGPQHLPPAW